MSKKTSQKKTGGCKAAKLDQNFLNSIHSKVPDEVYAALKFMVRPELITMKELRAERERVELAARRVVLKAALEYYFPGCKGIEPDAALEKSLRHLVFTNWLAEHQFTEKFEPLYALAI